MKGRERGLGRELNWRYSGGGGGTGMYEGEGRGRERAWRRYSAGGHRYLSASGEFIHATGRDLVFLLFWVELAS